MASLLQKNLLPSGKAKDSCLVPSVQAQTGQACSLLLAFACAFGLECLKSLAAFLLATEDQKARVGRHPVFRAQAVGQGLPLADEYFANFGIDAEHPIEIAIGETITIRITEPGQKVWLHIYVEESGYRVLYTNASGDNRLDADPYYTNGEGKLVANETLLDVDSNGDFWYLSTGDNYVEIYLKSGSTGTFEITLLPYA